jgi:hypothetical protein
LKAEPLNADRFWHTVSWLRATGYRLLATGYWLPATGYRLQLPWNQMQTRNPRRIKYEEDERLLTSS